MSGGRSAVLVAVVAVLATIGCGIAVRRDLSAVQPGQVGFDDMCGLQGYFDAIEVRTSPPPRVVTSVDLDGTSGGKSVRGGRQRFAFENDFQLAHLRRVLNENWRRLPDGVAGAGKIELEVKWSEKAGTKRVVTDEDAHLDVGGQSFSLPYHVCLSELLFGESLYRQRRAVWGLVLPPGPPIDLGIAAIRSAPDAGASDGAAPDGAGHSSITIRP